MFSFFIMCVNCSVGIPYKEDVTGFCDELHPLAQVGLFSCSVSKLCQGFIDVHFCTFASLIQLPICG